jgi:excisionase family DNA binding protein
MMYTLAEAAKTTGLEESLILKAIKDGQITATKNVSGGLVLLRG